MLATNHDLWSEVTRLLENNALISVSAITKDETITRRIRDDGLADCHSYALLDAAEVDGEW